MAIHSMPNLTHACRPTCPKTLSRRVSTVPLLLSVLTDRYIPQTISQVGVELIHTVRRRYPCTSMAPMAGFLPITSLFAGLHILVRPPDGIYCFLISTRSPRGE